MSIFVAGNLHEQRQRKVNMSTTTDMKHVVLEPAKKNADVLEFEERLRSKIIGQEEAVTQIVGVYQTMLAGMNAPGRPLANLLFLGPTGSGKTRLVEAMAETARPHLSKSIARSFSTATRSQSSSVLPRATLVIVRR